MHILDERAEVSQAASLRECVVDCRRQTLALADGLTDADATVQSMEDASPAKWHMAHTTWFFEEFVLGAYADRYRPVDARYRFLFNSYYEAVGARHPRPRRGLLTRPRLDEIVAYRRQVDAALERLLQGELPPAALELIELGVQHEQQHQELLLTDLLHLFAQNPLRPAYRPLQGATAAGRGASADTSAGASGESAAAAPNGAVTPAVRAVAGVTGAGRRTSEWVDYPGGCFEIGHPGAGFAFDCELPRHGQMLVPYALARRPVDNRQWLEFIADGGYRAPGLWLSDGWKQVQAEGWQAPLYWERSEGGEGPWRQMTLAGELALDADAPVSHVSFFEADAFARWAGARLPTEAEWEVAARAQSAEGNFASTGRYRPQSVLHDRQAPLAQLYGDVWEWTASPYTPYPGFRTAPGAVGEYNGKFMNGQYVLRGGSCATPRGHVRASYRNFFYPHQRWQFCGLRLARDL